MSRIIGMGQNPKYRKFLNDQNRQVIAEEAEKQTELMKQAEKAREREKEREETQKFVDEINNSMKATQDRIREEAEARRETEEYEFRRNQQIFDKISVDYNIVNDTIMELKEISEYLNAKQKVYTTFLEERKNHKVIDNEVNSESRISGIKYNLRNHKKITTRNIIILIIAVAIALFNIGNTIGNIAIGVSILFVVIVVINFNVKSNLVKDLNVAIEEQEKAKENTEKYLKEYEKLMTKISNIDSGNDLEWSSYQEQYNGIIKEWEEFRYNHYNREFETALKLIGVKDKNKLNEDKGTIQDYETYLENKIGEIKKLYKDMEQYIEDIENTVIEV